MIEIKTLLEIIALVIASIIAIFTAGRWFGWRHGQLVSEIKSIYEMLKKHIVDEEIIFERIEKKQNDHRDAIISLEKVCINGNLKK